MSIVLTQNDIYSAIVNHYSKRIYYLALTFVKNVDEAQDICQEVFIRVYRNLDKLNTDQTLYPWLYRVTKNLCINKVTKKESQNLTLEDWHHPSDTRSPETEFLRKEESKMIFDCIDQLAEKYREIIVLKHFQNCSYREISEIMGVPEGTVMSRLFTARQKLRLLLEENNHGM